MAKNKHKGNMPHRPATPQQQRLSNVVTVSGADALRRETQRLEQQGCWPAPMPNDFGHQSGSALSPGLWENYLHAQLMCNEKGAKNAYPTVHLSSGTEVATSDDIGTKGLGYMQWGSRDNNPNVISRLTEISPYTASAHRFNTDLCAGRGPRPVYAYVQYVGGNITEKRIPFQSAGVLIKGWLRDLRRELQKEQQEAQQSDGDSGLAFSPGSLPATVPDGSPSGDTPLIKDLKEQIATLEQDYARWEDTRNFLYGTDDNREPGFLRRNNLFLTNLALCQDLQQTYHCFPELTLNKRQLDKDGKQMPTRLWTPRITGIRYRSTHICRLERFDKNGRINYIYISNRWLDQHAIGNITADDYRIDAMPALDPQSPVSDLERIVRETRQKDGSIRRRPTRFILPVRYPTPGRPYYSVPANTSIYSGDIYEYLMTMISDRKKRRDNSNVIGRIIYIHQEWLQQLWYQKKCDTEEDKLKVFTELRNQINSFLEDRNNAGKPLVAYTFVGADGKVYESWRIVEIEAADKGSVEANQKELAEVSSIIFFAFGLDSRLVGNTPGDVSSSGGTDLRERYLLKQVQMSPMQQLLLSPLYVIKDFNRLDPHLEWEIPRETLTTLDNSKTGITTQPQE